jgi:hypothetical protein
MHNQERLPDPDAQATYGDLAVTWKKRRLTLYPIVLLGRKIEDRVDLGH